MIVGLVLILLLSSSSFVALFVLVVGINTGAVSVAVGANSAVKARALAEGGG